MDTVELFERLGLALAIGLLIGTERGWRTREGAAGSRTAGIRTYTLSAMLGAMWAALTPMVGAWPLAFGALAYGWAFTWFQWRESQAEKNFSVTGVVVGLLTFALGAYAVVGNSTVAVAAGIATVAVLASREGLHALLRKITWEELRAAIILLAMTFLLLPILPNETIDPWGALNPHKLWLLTILIAAVSFAGHVSMRVAGERGGMVLASAAGAVVSSTLVTLNNARLARDAEQTQMLAAATAVAWCVNLARVAFLAGMIEPSLLTVLWAPIGAAFGVLALFAAAGFVFTGGKGQGSGRECALKKPFDLMTVFGFGLLLAVVTLAAKLLDDKFQEVGIVPLAAIAGAADVDPVILSMADLARQGTGIALATLAILVAASANLGVRVVLALSVGGLRFGAPLAIAAVAAVAAGAGAWFLVAGHGMAPS